MFANSAIVVFGASRVNIMSIKTKMGIMISDIEEFLTLLLDANQLLMKYSMDSLDLVYPVNRYCKLVFKPEQPSP